MPIRKVKGGWKIDNTSGISQRLKKLRSEDFGLLNSASLRNESQKRTLKKEALGEKNEI